MNRANTTLLCAITAGDADQAGEVMTRRIAEVRAKVSGEAEPAKTVLRRR